MTDEHQNEPGAQQYIPLPGFDRAPVVTWILLAVNIVVWLAMYAVGGSQDSQVLLDFGAMFGPLIAEGRYWRLFTAMFLHGDLVHLAFNSIALFIFGRLLEGAYGRARFIVIYILAGLAGSVASYALNSISIGVGASGAIFGILGALAAFFAANHESFGRMAQRNLTVILFLGALNLLYGWITPGVDNWAHMGGLAAGFVLGFALAPRHKLAMSSFGTPTALVEVKSIAWRWWVVPAALAVSTAGALWATATLPDNVYSRLNEAERRSSERDYDAAFAELDKALELDPFFGEVYYERALILAELGDIEGAIDQIPLAIQGGDRETKTKAIALLFELSRKR